MKILLDECIDRRLAQEIEGHEVVTVSRVGWAGIENGELLEQQNQGQVLQSNMSRLVRARRC